MRIKAARLHVLLFTLGLGASTPGLAENNWDVDCHALKLKSATGVPKSKTRSYQFSGSCNINFVYSTGPSVKLILPAVANATWNGSTLDYHEAFHVTQGGHLGEETQGKGPMDILGSTTVNGGDISTGPVTSNFKCKDDPLVTKSSCVTINHTNLSGWASFSNRANSNRAFLQGNTTLAEAAVLSAQNQGIVAPADPTISQPPPASKSLAKPGTAPVTAQSGNVLNLPPARKSGGFVPHSERSTAPKSPAPAVGEANLGPAAAAATKPPPIEIIAVTTKIESSCKPPQPAASVNVTIRNNNPSPTGPGTLYLKETGGANLSGSLQLPGLAAGQTAPVVSVPLTTATPYSKLAGSHQVAVYSAYKGVKYEREPVMSTPTRMLTVTFPSGHCVVQRRAGAAAAGSASASVPAVQVSPGPPDSKQRAALKYAPAKSTLPAVQGGQP
jgi:hypothetical protein